VLNPLKSTKVIDISEIVGEFNAVFKLACLSKPATLW